MNNSEAERLQVIANNVGSENIKALQLMLVTRIQAKEAPKGFKSSRRCWECKHSRMVPGNVHIECVKPDVMMTGEQHGIQNGWFMYPLLFDPTWMTKECVNYESVSLVGKSNGESE